MCFTWGATVIHNEILGTSCHDMIHITMSTLSKTINSCMKWSICFLVQSNSILKTRYLSLFNTKVVQGILKYYLKTELSPHWPPLPSSFSWPRKWEGFFSTNLTGFLPYQQTLTGMENYTLMETGNTVEDHELCLVT